MKITKSEFTPRYKYLFISIFIICNIFYSSITAKGVDVSAKSAILICADSGSIVWSKNELEPLAMASTTKIMTSILTLEHAAAHGNKEVEITPEMVRVEGTSMGLMPGDIVDLQALATGMLLPSGNDAANAAAIAVSGDTEKFIELMNEKSRLLGMKDTKFSTPSGLDKDNHHSTAYDMAILGAYAMENEEFAKIVSQKSSQVKFINPSKTLTLKNHNKLLRLYENCIGIKTGFTKLAGRCLVSCAEKDGIRLVCVTLNAPSDWDDHMALYKYGFENTITKNFNDKNFKSTIKVVGSEKEEIPIGSIKDFSVNLKSEQENSVVRKVELPENHTAPIQRGQIIGKVIYYLDNRIIGENEIIALEEAPKKEIKKSGFFKNLTEFFSKIFRLKNKKEIQV